MQKTIHYRGKDYPVRLIKYKEVGDSADTQLTLAGDNELDQLIAHDRKCKVKEIKELAEMMDSKIGFFIHTVKEEEIDDHSLLVQLHDKNPDFVFEIVG